MKKMIDLKKKNNFKNNFKYIHTLSQISLNGAIVHLIELHDLM